MKDLLHNSVTNGEIELVFGKIAQVLSFKKYIATPCCFVYMYANFCRFIQ